MNTKSRWLAAAAIAMPILLAQPAWAKPGDPVQVSEHVTFDPIIDGRLRYETVDQDNGQKSADALTLRVRAGAEVKIDNLSLLAEMETTAPLVDNYNDTIPKNGVEPYPVVADPGNIELNRIQVGYKTGDSSVVIGRQRIILDNARFVGNVGWRQNEQTFDAIRGTTRIGPVSLDATYAISQNTIFGFNSPNDDFEGDYYLFNAGIKTKLVDVKGFAYLLDYDDRLAFSSKTFGFLAKANIPLGETFKLAVTASYANQTDYKANPVDYSADYLMGELGASAYGFGLKAGYEELGSDGGVAAFQTPLATLHAFNGWADLFLTTPATGLRDYYVGLSKGIKGFGIFDGLNAGVTYHKFEADFGGMDYGEEWDASLGFKIKGYGILFKYANYDADEFGVDTEKFWLQFEFSY